MRPLCQLLPEEDAIDDPDDDDDFDPTIPSDLWFRRVSGETGALWVRRILPGGRASETDHSQRR
jgi:hypothetical protein